MRKNSNLTAWFPPEIKPVHTGPCQVKSPFTHVSMPPPGYMWKWWDAETKRWGRYWATRELCCKHRVRNSGEYPYQNVLWRGLKEKQK